MTGGTVDVAFKGTLGRFRLDAAFAVPARGVTALHGPSGCGKTSVLRCIAGLTRLDGGRCIVGGDPWQDGARFRPPHRRELGYVFQEASLFPHLSVHGNLLYGAPRTVTAERRAGLAETVGLLGLSALLDRAPASLSGGERQRVALGRALLSRPKILLMDEPLSALDRRAKDEVLTLFERLRDRLPLPILYVSHDMREVERLADTLVLMEAGRVVASGPLAALQADPALPLAGARDAAVTLDGTVEGYDAAYGLLRVGTAGARLIVPGEERAAGARLRFSIAAGDVSLALEAPQRTSLLNLLPARVISLDAAGPHEVLAVLALGTDGEGARILSRLTRRSRDTLALAPDMPVYAQVKGVALLRSR